MVYFLRYFTKPVTMKACILIFLLLPILCFAQEDKSDAAARPSTTDCPTWKKKDKKAGKAEYFQYLRTSRPQTGKQTGYSSNTASKVQSNAIQQPTKKSEQKAAQQIPLKETQTAPDKPRKVKRSTPDSSDDKKVMNSSATELKRKEVPEKSEQVNTKTTGDPEKKSEESKALAETSDKPDAGKEDKLKDEKTKLKQKMTRLSRRTTKVRKHSNAKCPSF